ncbi:cell wall cysteine-rich protein [Culex quinquefasciatus]|uniref:Cell wall cysteine-rich protein n=1 Tax=Culex quinquefasciatus TaxID=7176 RepID=B0WDW3_CULQU|nr:cell wall cysteine-rich protein [Culex quinquefasciatus]|eukprot:XP_001846897.1 cell wall cysteine-rich protein [Culex quinquefasciatus]
MRATVVFPLWIVLLVVLAEPTRAINLRKSLQTFNLTEEADETPKNRSARQLMATPCGYRPQGACPYTQPIICPPGSNLENGRCIVRQTYCPSGYQLIGNQCQQPVCPTGYQMYNNMCHRIPAELSTPCTKDTKVPTCATNYTFTGTQCMKQESQPSVTKTSTSTNIAPLVCLQGYTLSQDKCIRYDREPARCYRGELRLGDCVVDAECPVQFRMDEYGRCVSVVDVPAICPNGTVLNGGVCQYPNPICPGNYTSINGRCVLEHSVPVQCKGSSRFVDNYCVVSEPTCPSGFTLNNSQCVQTRQDQARCPPGSYMQGRQCITKEVRCSSGVLQDGYCVEHDRQPIRCPPGSRFERGYCVSDQPLCRVDYEYDQRYGQCVKYDRRPAICDKGFRYTEGECVSERVSCDADYTIKNGECVRVEHSVEKCPSGSYLLHGRCVQSTPSCDRGFELKDGICVMQDQMAPICPDGSYYRDGYCRLAGGQACSAGFVLKDSQCVREQSAQPGCPSGFVYKRGYCLAQPTCDSGRLQQDVCVGSARCDQGYQMISGQCSRPDHIPAQCPHGFFIDYNRCVSKDLICPSEYRIEREECVRDRHDAVSCPAGSTLQGNVCVAGQPICEPGFKAQLGACVKHTYQMPQCPAQTVMMGSYCVRNPECPTDYRFTGGVCVKLQYATIHCTVGTLLDGKCIAPGPNCPDDYNFVENHCIQNRYESPSCPDRSRLAQNYCVVDRPQCPEGFKYSSSMCIRAISVAATCPPNYTLREERCVTDRVVTLQTCPNGYSLQGSLCVKVEYTAVSCPAGYNLEMGLCAKTVCSDPVQPVAPIAPLPDVGFPVPYPGQTIGSQIIAGQAISPGPIISTVTTTDPRPVDVAITDSDIFDDFFANLGNTNLNYVGSSVGSTASWQEIDSAPLVISNETREQVHSFNEESVVAVPVQAEFYSCTVISPKICTKYDDEWSCTNKHFENIKSRYCREGQNITLTVESTDYDDENEVLVMPVRTDEADEEYTEDNGDEEAEYDCSDCTGGDYDCSKSCYDYCPGCNHYLNVNDFCGEEPKPTEGCSREDGCRGDYCVD